MTSDSRIRQRFCQCAYTLAPFKRAPSQPRDRAGEQPAGFPQRPREGSHMRERYADELRHTRVTELPSRPRGHARGRERTEGSGWNFEASRNRESDGEL